MMWPKLDSPERGGRNAAAYRESFIERAARWLRRIVISVLGLAALAGGGYAGELLYRFTCQSEFFQLKSKSIEIVGASKPLEADARAELSDYLKNSTDNLCRLESKVIAARLTTLPRARTAKVSKVYPSALRVEFVERTPLMIANLDKRPYLVDEEGALLDVADPAHLSELALPMLTGIQGAPFHPGDRLQDARVQDILTAARFIRDSDATLRGRIVEWNTNSRHEVTAIMKGGVEVRFGDRPPLELLDKLSGGLQARPSLAQATYIDLRMDKQIVLKRK